MRKGTQLVKRKHSLQVSCLFGIKSFKATLESTVNGQERHTLNCWVVAVYYNFIAAAVYFFSSLRRGDQSTVFCIEKRDPGNEVALGLRSSRDRLARKFTRRRGSLCDHICFLWFLEQLWRLKLNEIWKLWLWADASMSKMPLVDNSEAGDRSSFRLRRIGTPATFPGISDTFK